MAYSQTTQFTGLHSLKAKKSTTSQGLSSTFSRPPPAIFYHVILTLRSQRFRKTKIRGPFKTTVRQIPELSRLYLVVFKDFLNPGEIGKIFEKFPGL